VCVCVCVFVCVRQGAMGHKEGWLALGCVCVCTYPGLEVVVLEEEVVHGVAAVLGPTTITTTRGGELSIACHAHTHTRAGASRRGGSDAHTHTHTPVMRGAAPHEPQRERPVLLRRLPPLSRADHAHAPPPEDRRQGRLLHLPMVCGCQARTHAFGRVQAWRVVSGWGSSRVTG
jgi:hypothetical protein